MKGKHTLAVACGVAHTLFLVNDGETGGLPEWTPPADVGGAPAPKVKAAPKPKAAPKAAKRKAGEGEDDGDAIPAPKTKAKK